MLNVIKGGHRDLERWYALVELDYDRRELLPRLAVHRAMSRGEQELLLFADSQSGLVQGYALVCTKNLYGYVLLKYLGILPWVRGGGLGLEAMRLINRRYAQSQGILAELGRQGREDERQRRRLKKFFARFGYVDVPCDFRLGGEPAELMVKPLQGTAELGPVAHRILPDFYARCLGPTALRRMLDIRPAEE